MPTGESDAQDVYPDSRGLNNQLRFVDQSVQPGDGGWGIVAEAQVFRRIKRVMLFGSGNYLVNPRNTNGTPSLTIARGVNENGAIQDSGADLTPLEAASAGGNDPTPNLVSATFNSDATTSIGNNAATDSDKASLVRKRARPTRRT